VVLPLRGLELMHAAAVIDAVGAASPADGVDYGGEF
jgi:hypothetical protein